jgi:2-keto-4-pentenoate hydratase/2-oxohepta-3-ene-1,7-dioic acid hydratase in catechol pathway
MVARDLSLQGGMVRLLRIGPAGGARPAVTDDVSERFSYLAAGDVVECEIDGLGRQRQQIAAG